MAKGVHFRGTVSSLYGYAVGAAGNETLVINSAGDFVGEIGTSASLTATNATITTALVTSFTGTTASFSDVKSATRITASNVKITGADVTSLTATNATFTAIDAVTSVTITNLTLVTLTTGSVKIGGATTGWNNAPTSVTYGIGAITSLNLANNSVFSLTINALPTSASTWAASITISATGGYLGQELTLVVAAGGTGGVVSFVNSGVTFNSTGDLTVTGSNVYAIKFLRGLNRFYEIARTAALT